MDRPEIVKLLSSSSEVVYNGVIIKSRPLNNGLVLVHFCPTWPKALITEEIYPKPGHNICWPLTRICNVFNSSLSDTFSSKPKFWNLNPLGLAV